MNNKIKKFRAFTLAEMLLTLGIIGIIAILTIPALRNSYAKKAAVAQLNKAVNMITDSAQAVIADESGEDDSLINEENSSEEKGFYYTTAGVMPTKDNPDQGVKYFLNNYFKHISTNCGSGASACVASNYKTQNDKNLGSIPEDFYCIKTVNHAAVCMRFDEEDTAASDNDNNTENTDEETPKSGVVKVIVDVNASQKPNITGRDLFVMKITNKGFLEDLNSDPAHCSTGTTILDAAAGCYTKVTDKDD